MVNNVKLVAILMFVQAGFEACMAVFYMAMGPFMSAFMDKASQGAPQPEGFSGMMRMMTGIYVVMGVLCLIPAIFRVVAGIKMLKFQGRILGIVSLVVGMASMLTCYCAPTAIALLVFGLIVLLNQEVVAAFEGGGEKNLDDVARTFE